MSDSIYLNEDVDWEPLLCDAEKIATEYVCYLQARGIDIRGGIRISKIWMAQRNPHSREDDPIPAKKLKLDIKSISEVLSTSSSNDIIAGRSFRKRKISETADTRISIKQLKL